MVLLRPSFLDFQYVQAGSMRAGPLSGTPAVRLSATSTGGQKKRMLIWSGVTVLGLARRRMRILADIVPRNANDVSDEPACRDSCSTQGNFPRATEVRLATGVVVDLFHKVHALSAETSVYSFCSLGRPGPEPSHRAPKRETKVRVL
jgi:hypothetical protein